MEQSALQEHNDTMVNEVIPKGLITVKLPYVSQPVSIYIEAYRLPIVLAELLDQDGVEVFDTVTIPQFIGHEIVLQPYTVKEVLDGDFKIST